MDKREALRWLRRNAAGLGIDSQKVDEGRAAILRCH
jgi:hypothetical protein